MDMKMKDNELLEELRIKKAADLVDTPAPVRLDTKRARDFVRETLERQQEEEVEPTRGIFSLIFRRPVYMWGGVGAIALASLALIITLSPTSHHTQEINPAASSVHAASDSLKTATDSTAIVEECIEIGTVEE